MATPRKRTGKFSVDVSVDECQVRFRFGVAYCLADAYGTDRPVPRRYRAAFEIASRQPTYSQALRVWLQLLAAEAEVQAAASKRLDRY